MLGGRKEKKKLPSINRHVCLCLAHLSVTRPLTCTHLASFLLLLWDTYQARARDPATWILYADRHLVGRGRSVQRTSGLDATRPSSVSQGRDLNLPLQPHGPKHRRLLRRPQQHLPLAHLRAQRQLRPARLFDDDTTTGQRVRTVHAAPTSNARRSACTSTEAKAVDEDGEVRDPGDDC
ncbi:hypothetical protein C8J57DRAFT_1718867 [Mycena rebaudengoi]|nr:hypothetical protein C8J57DRAFT_1718867 [Mycena rebaudengoi]